MRLVTILLLITLAFTTDWPLLAGRTYSTLHAQEAAQDEGETETPAQEPMGEMQMMERIRDLEGELQAQQISQRDKAEAELIKLGPGVLDFLELPEDEMTSDLKERLARVRKTLESQAAELVTQSSKVTLKGTHSLGKILKTIRQQTGNDVGLVDGIPAQLLDQKIVVDFNQTPFWKVMSAIMRGDTRLTVAPYSGGVGKLRLTPNTEVGQNDVETVEVEVPSDVSGIFHIQVTRIAASRNLLAPQNDHCNIGMLVRWEPRLRPISVDLAMAKVVITDEFDEKIEPVNADSVVSGVVQPEIPQLEFALQLKPVDRQVEVLKSIEGTIDAVLPGRIETFRFENLGDLERGAEREKAGVVVSYGGHRKNDEIWSVLVNIGFDETNDADESYLGWVYENEAYLLDENGTKHEYIGFESFSAEENRLGVQYLFDVDPAKCTLVYKTPAAIVKTPIKFKLVKIPLP